MKKIIKISLLSFTTAMLFTACRKDEDNINATIFENKLVKSVTVHYSDGTSFLMCSYKYDDQRRLTEILYGPTKKTFMTFTYDSQGRVAGIATYDDYLGDAKYLITYNGSSQEIAKFSKQNFKYNTTEEIAPQYDMANHTVTYKDAAGDNYNIKTDIQDKAVVSYEKKGLENVSFSFEYDMDIANGLINSKTPVMPLLYIVAGDYVNIIGENNPYNVITNYAIKKYTVTDEYNTRSGYMENTKTTGNLLEKSRIHYATNRYRDITFLY